MKARTPLVILVEDDDALRTGAAQALELEGMAVSAHAGSLSALKTVSADFAGVVVSDVRMPGIDGIEFFARLRAIDEDMQVIFTTAHGDVEMAVEAMRNGASDFFTKPYSIGRLAQSVHRAIEKRALILENRRLRTQLRERAEPGLIGHSEAAERLQRIIREVARTETDLLVTGAPGTGKSHITKLVHDQSERRDRPFVVVDPGIFANDEVDLLLFGREPGAALSRSGLIERAHGGTLVLEAINQIPHRTQARLTSLLDTRSFLAIGAERPRPVDVRIIATTSGQSSGNRENSAGDNLLLPLIDGVTIELPPLAERREDIPDLFHHFVAQSERRLDRQAGKLSAIEWQHLLTHDWPGNIRELQMFAQNFTLGLTRIGTTEGAATQSMGLREIVADFEKSLLQDSLRRAGGSIAIVQRHLLIPRKTLYDKLARYSLRPGDFRKMDVEED